MIKRLKILFKNKIVKRLTYSIIFILIGFTIWSNYAIISFSNAYITDDISKVKNHKVALLLGTSKYRKNGQKNEYFFNRIEAVHALYKKNKIKFILVSGDRSSETYNEPEDMKNELIKKGIPSDIIFLDYAGYSTLESVIRANKVYGLKNFLVVSQKFHNQRAVYLARKYKISANGFNAKDVTAYWGIKTKLREILARNKVFIDMIFKSPPSYSGETVNIK